MRTVADPASTPKQPPQCIEEPATGRTDTLSRRCAGSMTRPPLGVGSSSISIAIKLPSAMGAATRCSGMRHPPEAGKQKVEPTAEIHDAS